jgi:phosphoenolpyruvate-protein phosphotransferase (PTS system enzyme I)
MVFVIKFSRLKVRIFSGDLKLTSTFYIPASKPSSFMPNANTTYLPSEKEITLEGLSASRGIAIGKTYVFSRDRFNQEEGQLSDDKIPAELARLQLAIERSEKELSKIALVTEQKVGANYSQIFTAQILMLNDDTLVGTVRRRIQDEHRYASTIICEEISKYQQILLGSSESYFRERVDDIQDLKDRLLRNLHEGHAVSRIPENVIVIASLLTPADVILFSRQNILGCAAQDGGLTSHAALICQSLDIPMVIGLHHIDTKIASGETIIVDGFNGSVILYPKPETISQFERKQKRTTVSQSTIEKFAHTETRTKCQKRIHLYSNVDFKEEAASVEKYGSEGIGLYRSEHLFLSSGKQPSEAEQFDYYLELATKLAPKPLTIRLFDIGGDKLLYSSHKEENPNLGWRGVRILIDVPDILEAQLKAILKANLHSNIRVMIPMIASMEEIFSVKKVLQKVKSELRRQKEDFVSFELGVMIEVPAAVELIDEILQEVDFVSIGTNDLIQYTLAVDRNNEIVQNLYNKFHPGVVRKIAKVLRAGRRHKIPVSLCGEMASDKMALPLLLGLGLEEFSVVSAAIPVLKKHIASIRLEDAKELAQKCQNLSTSAEIEQELRRFKPSE